MVNAFSIFLRRNHPYKGTSRIGVSIALFALFLLGLGGMPYAVAAAGGPPTYPVIGTRVRTFAAYCDQTEVTLGETFRVVVTARYFPHELVTCGGLEALHESLALTGVSTVSHLLAVNYVEETWIYTLTPTTAGAFLFPPLYASFWEPGTPANQAVKLSSRPLYLDVYALAAPYGFPEGELKKVAPISPWARWIGWLISLGLLIPCGTILRKAFVRPKPAKAQPEKPEGLEALELLEELKKEYYLLLKDSKTINTPEDVKEFYYRLSRFVRGYFDAAYQTQMSMKTPLEIRSVFSGTKEIEMKTLEEVLSFLVRCDSVKYRPLAPLSEPIDSDIRWLKKITASISKRKIG